LPEENLQKTITLVIGGVRSGKSRYAQELTSHSSRAAFLATAEALDDDMSQRIAQHKSERPASWATVEAPIALEDALLECGDQFDTLLVDCLTLWTSNLLTSEGRDRNRIFARADRLCEVLRSISASVVLVTNEVGSGVVPVSEDGRLYRDLLGYVNQRVAAVADKVVLLVAGCPLMIKQPAEALS
jgi:adenosylcobinamide kinase/adenosylcobinamide-phosphate guanylyltransferase